MAMSVVAPQNLPMGNSANRAQAKETIWRLCALTLSHPAPEFHAAIESGVFHAAFDDAWSKVTGRRWPRAKASTDFATFEAGFITAFLHGYKGKPIASLLSGDHEDILKGLTRPVFMLNIGAMYKHFGLKAATSDEGRHDEPDHVTSMLEFMSVLCHLETQTLRKDADASAYRRAQRDFLCRYLAPTLAAIAGGLRHTPVPEFDPTVAQIVEELAQWSSVQITELEARVGPFRDPDAPKPVLVATSQDENATQNLWG